MFDKTNISFVHHMFTTVDRVFELPAAFVFTQVSDKIVFTLVRWVKVVGRYGMFQKLQDSAVSQRNNWQ